MGSRAPTVDDSRDPPQQQNDKHGGRLLSLLTGHAAQKDDVDCKRRYDDERVENLPKTTATVRITTF